jgi:hypothetical protein
MSKISTYPILSTPTLNDLLIGTDVENLNETKNFSLSSIGNLIGQNYVPYVGATGNVDLGVYSIEGSAFIVNGGTASQFLKADGTLDSTFYVPQTRTITINSVGYDLSANRSWDLPTIDSLTTLGTSGAATYIGKVLNIPIYQAQGNYITQLSGEATALGPGNATVTLSNSAVISKVLTGLNITGGNVIATDTILQAFGKVQNQINGLTGGVTYQGTWNAATNTPFLQSSVGTKGYYYVVSVPGTTNLNGITDWQLGDWAIYNGTAWEKVDNTDAVVSVNGYTGAVMLTYSDVGAPPATRTLTINGVGYDLSLDRSWTVGNVRTDQTYADPSWITSLGWSKIINTPTTLAGYGITDGVSTARTLTINGVGYNLTADRTWSVGTVTSVGTTAPLTGGTITGSGTIGITQASAISDGYLSSTDWSTFNSKQDAITASAPLSLVAGTLSITQAGVSSDGYLSSTDWNTFNSKVGGSGTANYLPIWTSSSVLGNSSLSFSLDTLTVGYNSVTGGAVSFTNIGLTPYTYSIQMNNFGSPRSTFHNYTDGIIVQAIASTQVSRMFDNGNFILGTGTTDTGHKLTISGDLYVNTIANAIVDTDRFIVSDGGIIKYRTGAQILTDIGAVSSVGLTMPAAFTVSNSPITSSGTIAVTGAGTAAQYIRGDGTLGDFPGGGGGGGASVSYYLNGSVNQGTFGGNTYYEMNKTPIFGPGTDFNISVDGYVAQFITDVGDPDALLIPGGNWNFETYFSASSGGGSPTFYIELYKYDGTTFTLIASNSTNPELIAFGTTVNPYFSALAVPETVLLATDRLAVRIYVSTSGRTITLHTENSNLCQVITTFTTGLTALNGLTKQVQYFTVGTSGTDFNISSSVATHTFNLPTASAVNRGALSSSDWTTFNSKQNALTLTTSGSSGPATLVGATLNIPDYGSALSGYVPYTGASQAVNLGIHSLSGGSLFVNGPSPTSGSYLGFKQATSVTTGGGGYTSISTFGTSQMNFSFAQTSGFKEFKFDVSSITTGVPGGRVYTMPDADGTIALTSNIPSGIITGTGTTNYLPKFTGTSSIGNSIVQDAGIRVDIGGDIRLTPTSAVNIQAYTGSVYTNLFYNAASHNWQTSGGATKMFLNSNDNLLIGTTTDGGQKLQVTGTFALRASASGSSATQIPIFNADPSGTTRELVTRTPAQLLSDIGGQAALTNPVTGTGTTNYLPKFTGSTTIGNSIISESGSVITIAGNLNVGSLGSLSINAGTAATPLLTQTTNYTEIYRRSGGVGIYLGGTGDAANYYDNTIHYFRTPGGGSTRMTLDASGNLGLGVTPSAWSLLTAMQIKGGAFISGYNNNTYVGANWYFDGIVGRYLNNDFATSYIQTDGEHQWLTATSGTAGNTISFTQAMTLTSGGNLLVGTPTDNGARLQVSGTATFSSTVTSNGAGFIIQGDQQYRMNGYNSGYSYITTNAGFNGNYNGVGIFSNATNANSLPAWLLDLGGLDGPTRGITDAFVIARKASGGSWNNYLAINASGNVGIGTASPTSILNIADGSGATRLTVDNTANAAAGAGVYMRTYSGGSLVSNATVRTDNAGNFAIFTGTSTDGERMRITSGGNVGIGTSSPNVNGLSTALTINGSSTSGLEINANSVNQGYLIASTSAMVLNARTNIPLLFYTNDIERMRITSGGEILVSGTYNPFPATNRGNITLNGSASNIITFTNNVTPRGYIFHTGTNLEILNATTSGVLQFYTESTERGRFTSGGNLLIGTTTDVGSKLRVNGVGYFDDSIFSGFQGLNVGGYNFYSQTLSGAMGILGHNLRASGSVANQVNVVNSGWYSSMIKMYYSEGITFHTSTTVYSAGDVYPMAGTERMRIAFNGRIGMGTNDPIDQLHVAGGITSTGLANPTTTSVGSLQIGYDGTTGVIRTWNSSPLLFSNYNHQTFETSGSIRMRITSGGNVLIGTTTDVGARLYVDGAFRTGTLTAGTQTAAVDWRLGNARGGTATANALVRVQINGVLVDLIGNYV